MSQPIEPPGPGSGRPYEPPTGRPIARPAGRRPVLVPTLVIVLATALLVSAAGWTFTPDPRLRDRFVAADGLSGPATLNGADGWIEHAVGSGTALYGAGAVGVGLTAEHDREWTYDTHLARTLVRTGSDQLQVLFGVDRDQLTLESLATEKIGLISAPPVVLSDDRVDDRDHWSGQATVAFTGAQYAEAAVEVRAEDAGACRQWQITFDADQRDDYHLDLKLCPGRGLTRLQLDAGEAGSITMRAGEPGPRSGRYQGSLQPERVGFDEVAGWQPQLTELSGHDGLSSAPVFSATDGEAAFTASGLLLLPTRMDRNLTAVRLTGDEAQVAWRAHPGGAIAELITAGDLILVATSHRQLIAYDRRGRRVWEIGTQELVTGMELAGTGRLVLTLANGVVLALSVREGGQLWRFDEGGRSDGLIAADEQTVAVADLDGWVRGLDTRTGQTLWYARSSRELRAGDLVVIDGSTAVMWTGRVEIFGPYGRFLWGDTTRGGDAIAMSASGDSLIYSSTAQTLVADMQTGRRIAGLPMAEQLVDGAGGPPLLLADGQATAIAPDGRTAGPWQLTNDPGGQPCRCAVGPDAAVFADVAKLTVIR